MYTEVSNRVSKAAIRDDIPKGVKIIIVAREYLNSGTGLRDSMDDSIKQQKAVKKAVETGLSLLKEGKNVCFVCAAGMSRSVTMACLVAALWEGTTFDHMYDQLWAKDAWILNPSPVRPLVERLYPYAFEVVKEVL